MNHLSKLDPTSLKLFVSVLQEGTIAATAARENMAAAAVSKRLSELEDTLRIGLLLRTNKGVEPTVAGVALLNLARTALNGLDDVYVQMRDYAAGVRGRIKVLADLSAIIQFLPSDVSPFLAQHSGVDIDFEGSSSELIVKAIAENVADLGVGVAVAHPETVQASPYHHERFAIIVPSSHALAGARSISFLETLDFQFVDSHPSWGNNARLSKVATYQNRTFKVRVQAIGYDVLCNMVHAGLGIGIVPEAIATQYSGSLQIQSIRLDEPWAEREIKIYIRRYQAPSAAARLLVDHLKCVSSLKNSDVCS
jgi:DNA-binding transcriptional LysR family regulator